MKSNEPLNVLLVEDDEVDAEAIMRELARSQPDSHCTIVEDGVDALAHLRSNRVPSPTVILLDLNLPRMNGIEFLTQLRADPSLHRHIVFVLTTSDRHEDKVAAYDRHVAGYCVKGRNRDSYSRVVNLLHSYRQTVTFPPI